MRTKKRIRTIMMTMTLTTAMIMRYESLTTTAMMNTLTNMTMMTQVNAKLTKTMVNITTMSRMITKLRFIKLMTKKLKKLGSLNLNFVNILCNTVRKPQKNY